VILYIFCVSLDPLCLRSSESEVLQKIPKSSTESVGLFALTREPMLAAWNVSSTCPPFEQELVKQCWLLLLAFLAATVDERPICSAPGNFTIRKVGMKAGPFSLLQEFDLETTELAGSPPNVARPTLM